MGLVLLLWWAGLGDVETDLSRVGWMLIPVSLIHLPSIVVDAAAWRTLTPRPRPGVLVFAAARWIREGVNALLPAAQIGGEVVAVRLLSRLGDQTGRAGAIVAIDLATEFLAMAIVGVLGGVALLMTASPMVRASAWLVVVAMAPPLAISALFLLVQRTRWLAPLSRRAAKRWPKMAAQLKEAQGAATAAWSRPWALAGAIGLHGLGWASGGLETWIMLKLIDHPLSLEKAFALETTSEVIRSLGFAMPGLLVAQEGSLVLVRAIVGLPASTALALSLFRRARDVTLGVPGLGVWQFIEHRQRLRLRRAQTD